MTGHKLPAPVSPNEYISKPAAPRDRFALFVLACGCDTAGYHGGGAVMDLTSATRFRHIQMPGS
jgi:hypothetical protein